MNSHTDHLTKRPPADTIRIMRVADLPRNRGPWTYEITNPGQSPFTAVFCKRQRQALDLLMRGPLYCASPVRLSDIVFILKRERGLDIHTEHYPGDKDTGSGDYGVYFLRSKVRRIGPKGGDA